MPAFQVAVLGFEPVELLAYLGGEVVTVKAGDLVEPGARPRESQFDGLAWCDGGPPLVDTAMIAAHTTQTTI